MKLDSKLLYSEQEVDWSIGVDEAIKKSKDNLDKLISLSIQAQPKHHYLGNYFRLNVADGYVYYQTIEYDKKKEKYQAIGGQQLESVPKERLVELGDIYVLKQESEESRFDTFPSSYVSSTVADPLGACRKSTQNLI